MLFSNLKTKKNLSLYARTRQSSFMRMNLFISMEFQGERHDLANIPFYFDVRTPKVGDRTGFTRREKEVIELILEDRSNKEIAKQLSISERTTKFHVSEILLKLKVRKRAEIIKMLRPDGDTR